MVQQTSGVKDLSSLVRYDDSSLAVVRPRPNIRSHSVLLCIMYDAVRRDFALSTSFVLECFDGSELTTREGNELVVQKETCVVEEI